MVFTGMYVACSESRKVGGNSQGRGPGAEALPLLQGSIDVPHQKWEDLADQSPPGPNAL